MMRVLEVEAWRVWAKLAAKGKAGAGEVIRLVFRVLAVAMEAGVGAVGEKLVLMAALGGLLRMGGSWTVSSFMSSCTTGRRCESASAPASAMVAVSFGIAVVIRSVSAVKKNRTALYVLSMSALIASGFRANISRKVRGIFSRRQAVRRHRMTMSCWS